MDRRQALRGRPERVDNTPRDDNETDLRNRQPTGDTNKDRTEDTTADIERRGRATTEIHDSEERDYEKEKRWRTHFGDERSRTGPHDKHVARFITHNIGGFPDMGSTKFLRIREELANVDCVGLSEINRNWYKINAQDSLHRRIHNWWPRQKT